MTLSKRAREFQDHLNAKGLDIEVLELPDSTRTAEEAASAIGTSVAQIVKSLVFKNVETSLPVLVLASGPNRVNEKTIAAHLGSKPAKADAAFVKEMTGFTIGGVPPLGHMTMGDMFVDETLLQFDEIWAAAGTPHAVFCIKNPATALAAMLPEHKIISVV